MKNNQVYSEVYEWLKRDAEESGIYFDDFKDEPQALKSLLEKMPAFLGSIAFTGKGAVIMMAPGITGLRKALVTACLITQHELNRGKDLVIRLNEKNGLSFYGEIPDGEKLTTVAAISVEKTRAEVEKEASREAI